MTSEKTVQLWIAELPLWKGEQEWVIVEGSEGFGHGVSASQTSFLLWLLLMF